jgi:uncharacterized protein YjbI with pentapeptide repeats
VSDFSGAESSGAEFSGAKLSGAEFSYNLARFTCETDDNYFRMYENNLPQKVKIQKDYSAVSLR